MINFLFGLGTGALLMIICMVLVIFSANEDDERNIELNKKERRGRDDCNKAL